MHGPKAMRRAYFMLTLLATATAWGAVAGRRPATAAEVALLQEAMKNTDQDTEHWAYTESTTVKASKGIPRVATVVRFDPSKPYAEQYTPLLVDGKPPTAKELKKYRKQGEKRGKARMRTAEKAGPAEDERPQMKINDKGAGLDIEHPLVVQDDADRILFEIPVLDPDKSLPVEKLEILVQVGKRARHMEKAMFRIKHAFRLKLVAKIKSGEASLEFTVVNPEFSPVITSITGNFGASFLLIPVNATFTNTRTDWQRVRAYDERFSVKMAPLQLLGF
jgi:hypothetical protein